MTAAVLLGGLCWVPATAHACEGHTKAAASKTAPPPASTEATGAKAKEAAPRPLEELDKVLTAKCSCGSKADCTCKRGKCECSKCSGRHDAPAGQVMDVLRGRPATQELQEARYDASAGVFI